MVWESCSGGLRLSARVESVLIRSANTADHRRRGTPIEMGIPLRHQTRTTLNIDDELLAKAGEYTGETGKMGLEALVEREAARRLAALGGAMPALEAPPRRRKARVLEFVESAVIDASRYQAIVARRGLTDAWKRFEKQFLGDVPWTMSFELLKIPESKRAFRASNRRNRHQALAL